MKVLGIIPARFASSRFPGKPLIDLKGKSMIQRVYEGAMKSTRLDEVVVATDDQRILDHVLSFGGQAMMTSTAHSSGSDRCGEVLTQFQDFDIVVNIQGDEPLVAAEQLDQLIRAFEDKEVNIATLGIKNVSKEDLLNVNRIKLVLNAKNDALYFSRSEIPSSAHASQDVLKNFPYLRHIGLYAYRSEVLKKLISLEKTKLEQIESLEQLRWLYHGFSIRVVETNIETPNIDVPEDVAKVLPFL
ncbi:MAG: 3-deoxy-manno-octulosonate cytidylyltransferase [Bacteroidetes bacterium]|nr:3-deoxy-manno-octulosonate cytidylyltransferase [Bacteroidota bacterium]